MKRAVSLFIILFLVACTQPVVDTATSEEGPPMTPDEVKELIESGHFEDESNKPASVSTSATSPSLVNICLQKCNEASPFEDKCNQRCEDAEEYGGTKGINDLIAMYDEMLGISPSQAPEEKINTVVSTEDENEDLLSQCIKYCMANQPDMNQIEDEGVRAQAQSMAEMACYNSCGMVNEYGTEDQLRHTIQVYKGSLQFEEDLANGVYDADVEQCIEWKKELVIAQNEHWHFIKNFNEAHQKDIDVIQLKTSCTNSVEDWVKGGQAEPLGIEFQQEAEEIKAKEKKVMEECYPIKLEYSTLVFTSRGEMDQHPDLEKEVIEGCLNKVDDADFDEYIKGIEQDIPNWR